MSNFIGRNLAVGIGKETVKGTGVDADYWLGITSFSHKDDATSVMSEAGTGGIWMNGDQSLVSTKFAEGDLEFEMDDQSLPLVLLATFGTLASAAEVAQAGAYRHTLTLLNTAQHPSLSIITKTPDSTDRFAMGIIDSLSMDFELGSIVKCSMGTKSQPSATHTDTVAFVANNKFLGRQMGVKIADDVSGLDAATALTASKASINIAKNADFYNVIGLDVPADVYNKGFAINGEIELSFDDLTYKNYVMDGTYKALRLELENTSVTIGVDISPKLVIDLPKVAFSDWDADYAMDDLVKQSISFTALFDITTGKVINSCYVLNEVANY